ncbi:MAG: AraC family transcriptional regulator [Pseudomonadota bacterium]
MQQFTHFGAVEAPVLFELDKIDRHRRAAFWASRVPTLYPGLSVRRAHNAPAFGSIRGISLGPARLLSILSGPALVDYRPTGWGDDTMRPFSLVLQLEGATEVEQGGRRCALDGGEICMVDARDFFQFEILGLRSKFLILEVPRTSLIARHPHLQDMTSISLDLKHEGTLLLRNLLLQVFDAAPKLDVLSRNLLLPAIVHLVGTQAALTHGPSSQGVQRYRMALARIEAEIGDPTLGATAIAQGLHISRHHLDLLLKRRLGVSVAERIRQRRLERAAEDLQDPAQAVRSVTEIALSLGFESSAHFTRTFRKRYWCTPGEWRKRRQGSTPLVC